MAIQQCDYYVACHADTAAEKTTTPYGRSPLSIGSWTACTGRKNGVSNVVSGIQVGELSDANRLCAIGTLQGLRAVPDDFASVEICTTNNQVLQLMGAAREQSRKTILLSEFITDAYMALLRLGNVRGLNPESQTTQISHHTDAAIKALACCMSMTRTINQVCANLFAQGNQIEFLDEHLIDHGPRRIASSQSIRPTLMSHIAN